MSIHFISGKPGGGKSMYAVKLILDELIRGSRPVFTNVPLHVGRLSEYLQQNGKEWAKLNGELDGHIRDRVRLLSDEETAVFWTLRPGNKEIPNLSEDEWRKGRKPVYEGLEDSGVFYVIDEVHNFFGARQWAETGRNVLYYLSQHRKLGDDVVCITQAIGNVDKQFRSVAQDFTYLRNLSKEKVGVVRLPSYFIRKTYGAPATDTSRPMETGTFKLDVSGLGSLYDTAKGVGIHGRAADTNQKKTGIHWLVWVVGVVLAIILFAKFVPPLAGRMFKSPHKAVSLPASQKLHSRNNATNAVALVAGSNSFAGVVTITNLPLVTAVERLSGRWRAWLSDGTVYYQGDGYLEIITENYVQIAGNKHYFARLGEKKIPSVAGATPEGITKRAKQNER